MKKRSILALLMTVAMTTGVLTGCGQKAPEVRQETQKQEENMQQSAKTDSTAAEENKDRKSVV